MIPYCLLKIRKERTYSAFTPVYEKEIKIDFVGYRTLELSDGVSRVEEIAEIISHDMKWDKTESLTYVINFLNDMSRQGIITWRKQPSYKTKLPAPKQVFWDITAQCNLHCLHCYNSDGNPYGNELSNEKAMRALSEMHKAGVENIIFSGGEPFLKKEFLELVVFAAKLGFAYVSVATNGTVLDREKAAQLKHPNLYIQVSIDGDTAELHDRIRGKQGSFHSAIEAVRILMAEGVHFKVCTTVTTINVSRVPNIIELMNDLGVKIYRFQGMVPVGRGKRNAKNIMLSQAQKKSLVEYLVGKNLDPGGLSFTLKPSPNDPVDFNASGSCSAGYTTCSITSDGTIVPCTYFWGLNGDNIKNHSFQWIWEHSTLLNYFRNIKLDEIKGPCRECEWFMRCLGGCRAECYMDGDLFGSNRNCWVAEERAQKLQMK